MIMRFALLAGAMGLLSSPHGSDAFTLRMSAAPRMVQPGGGPGQPQPQPQIPQQMPPQPAAAAAAAQPQQFYDANGNPVSMPMVYDANGNLVPFNPAAMMQQQQQAEAAAPPAVQPAAAADYAPQRNTPPQINPNADPSFQAPIVVEEPPLPPKTKGADSPRPVGYNADAYTMSNTADVYLAQLKQDTKIRKIARMSGDFETANTVFGDDSVREIGESFNENPYTKEKNYAEARAEIEGTVRIQVMNDDDAPDRLSSGISYKQKLEQMKAKRAGGANIAQQSQPPQQQAPPAASVAPPQVVEQPKVAAAIPPPPKIVQPVATNVVPPPPQIQQPKMDMPPPAAQKPAPAKAAASPAKDPLEDTVATVETVLAMYKRAKTAAERKGMVKTLRGALMSAATETNELIEKKGLENGVPQTPATNAAPVSPVSEQPVMGFPTSYAVTKPDDDEPAPAQSAPVVASTPAVALDTDLQLQLETAVSKMDAPTVTSLLEAGAHMDEGTTDSAFWAIVNAVDRAEALDQPLPADVPQMLHHIFDADLSHLLTREQQRTNVTCMMPTQEGANRIGMNYIFDDSAAMDLPLEEGRRCEDGSCCDACSRNIFPTFAMDGELDFDTFEGINTLSFNELQKVSAATILQFVRLIERVRRTISHEYNVPLASLLPLQAYSRKYVAGTTQQGGGGGEGDFVILHTDEATHDGYHYSCVMYMSTSGVDFEGGDFVFNDPLPPGTPQEDLEHLSLEEQRRRVGRKLTPFSPIKGSAVIFSSGWENMHEVEKITSGTRYVVPAFFTTCPVPQQAYDQMHVGKPKTDEDIADDWLHLLLAHRAESPVEAAGRVKELLMKWHTMCAPLSMH